MKFLIGITPAQAGKRVLHLLHQAGQQDHPRAGGEKEENQPGPNWELGSPPRRRGKVVLPHLLPLCLGITPAQAGKRAQFERPPPLTQDHPRAGGEKGCICMMPAFAVGSPPRRRGKARGLLFSSHCARITPAQAGKRYLLVSQSIKPWDHPRAGGEKNCRAGYPRPQKGSPPRRRGKGCPLYVVVLNLGITPAQAGKSAGFQPAHSGQRDHPRAGGEKMRSCRAICSYWGSPPRRRGKVSGLFACILRCRITPAQAGKRLKRSHRSGIFISGPIPFHSVLHRPAGSGGSRAGRDGSPAGQPQNAGPA